MKIKIDQDDLCDHCEECSNVRRDTCEGSNCVEAKDSYLDNVGLEEDTDGRSFEDLRIGDSIYHLDFNEVLPKMERLEIKGISLDDTLSLHVGSHYIRVDKSCLKQVFDGNNFLVKRDCEKALEKECIDRILKLSKIIGSIK